MVDSEAVMCVEFFEPVAQCVDSMCVVDGGEVLLATLPFGVKG